MWMSLINGINTLRATASLFVVMYIGIVNGYQLLYDAHTVLGPHTLVCLISIPVCLFWTKVQGGTLNILRIF